MSEYQRCCWAVRAGNLPGAKGRRLSLSISSSGCPLAKHAVLFHWVTGKINRLLLSDMFKRGLLGVTVENSFNLMTVSFYSWLAPWRKSTQNIFIWNPEFYTGNQQTQKHFLLRKHKWSMDRITPVSISVCVTRRRQSWDMNDPQIQDGSLRLSLLPSRCCF